MITVSHMLDRKTVDNVHQTEAMSERIKLLRNNGLKNWCGQVNHASAFAWRLGPSL